MESGIPLLRVGFVFCLSLNYLLKDNLHKLCDFWYNTSIMYSIFHEYREGSVARKKVMKIVHFPGLEKSLKFVHLEKFLHAYFV